jgi:hypothetical protein
VPIAARRFSVHPPKSSPVDGFAVPMALHLFGGWHAFDCGISRDQACKWCNEWDLCVPGLSCRFASERTLRFRWPPSANVGLDGVIYSDRVSNLLVYLGAESAVSSENPLKSLRILGF